MPAADSSLAETLADIRRGNVRRHPSIPVKVHRLVVEGARDSGGPLVDATMIYDTYRDRPAIAIYEDHPCILPPWRQSFVGYRNQHGNANVTWVDVNPWADIGDMAWESEHEGQDTSGAEWCYWLWFFGGGRSSGGGAVPTFGPTALTQIAVAADGTPIDIHWVDLLNTGRPAEFDWSRWTVLGVFNLLNCQNTELVEASMARPDRRREQRLGIRSHVISVRPTRKVSNRRRQGGPSDDVSVPLHSVRGHVAHYGDCCPGRHPANGRLFGRVEGRVWVPQHARGAPDVGEVDQTFVVADC